VLFFCRIENLSNCIRNHIKVEIEREDDASSQQTRCPVSTPFLLYTKRVLSLSYVINRRWLYTAVTLTISRRKLVLQWKASVGAMLLGLLPSSKSQPHVTCRYACDCSLSTFFSCVRLNERQVGICHCPSTPLLSRSPYTSRPSSAHTLILPHSLTDSLTTSHEEESMTESRPIYTHSSRHMHTHTHPLTPRTMESHRLTVPFYLCTQCTGAFDGQEWLRQDLDALHYLFQLHRKGHSSSWSHQ
jgi:hypothetical protein